MARILITSAIPYINGIKHLGNLVGSQLPADLHARFSAITDPAEQTAFWRRLTPEQQALILKHQA